MSDSFPYTPEQHEINNSELQKARKEMLQVDLSGNGTKGLTDLQVQAEVVFRRLNSLEKMIFDQDGCVINQPLLSELTETLFQDFYRIVSASEDPEYVSFISDSILGIHLHTLKTSLERVQLNRNIPYLMDYLDSVFYLGRSYAEHASKFGDIKAPAREQILNLLLVHLTSKDKKEYKKRMQTLQRQRELIGETLSDRGFEFVEKLLYPKS